MKNSVRIIGGAWRSRMIHFPDQAGEKGRAEKAGEESDARDGFRPSADRVRETLFNWLGQDLTGLTCLDLFAGSGALGFEAASRGASQVCLVELSPLRVKSLRENADLLHAEQVKIVRSDAVKFAAGLCATKKSFDLVFLDPPYRQGWLEKLAPFLPRLVKDDGFLYIEAEKSLERAPLWQNTWQIGREGRAGQVFYHLLQKV